MRIQPDLNDRVDLLRSTLHPYPLVADESSAAARRFGELVDRLGGDAVFGYLRERKIVHAALAAHPRHEQVADPEGPFGIHHRVSQAVAGRHRRELARIAKAFSDSGIPLIAFKGVATDAVLGNTHAPSYSNDIDVLVARRDLDRARSAMRDLGYGPEIRMRAGRPYRMAARLLEASENSVYSFGQLAPLDRLVATPELQALASRALTAFPTLFCRVDGELHMKLSIDLHYSLNPLTDDIGTRVKPSEELWLEETESVDIDGVEVLSLTPRALSWALPHRLYVDSTLLRDTSLKPLCHLKLLWHHGRFNRDHVRDVALRHPYLAPSLHHALRAMDQLCGTRAQPSLDPERIRTNRAPLADVGDCLPALLGCGVEVTLGPPEAAADGPGVTTLLV